MGPAAHGRSSSNAANRLLIQLLEVIHSGYLPRRERYTVRAKVAIRPTIKGTELESTGFHSAVLKARKFGG
jgi:hypothetical protein